MGDVERLEVLAGREPRHRAGVARGRREPAPGSPRPWHRSQAPGHEARLFCEFQQLGTDVATRQEGTGLGLALTKRIVEAHGGRMGGWARATSRARGAYS